MHSPLTTPINFCICVDSLIQLFSRTSFSVYVRIYPIYLNTRKGWTHTCGPLGESFCCLSGPLRHKIQVWSSLCYYFLHSTGRQNHPESIFNSLHKIVSRICFRTIRACAMYDTKLGSIFGLYVPLNGYFA